MHPSLAYLPSPRDGVWHLGPIPIRAYALCIILGIIAAVWIGERRWVARGGHRGTVSDVAVWAVVFGLIGGRLYHVITDPELYFGAGRHPLDAFKVWQGGLGIWGAISLGGVGAWIGCHRRGIKLPPYADAVAPGIAVAQAIGRWGNWFNQELFGKPTTLPWGVKIDPGRPNTVPGAVAYQPTFLYESLWDLALAGALVLVDRRYKMGRGRVFALYAMGYTAGRVWIEALRIDTAHHVLGLRVNIWTSIIVFTGALIYFLRHPGPRETVVEPAAATAEEAAEAPEIAGKPDAATESTAAAADADAASEADTAEPRGPDAVAPEAVDAEAPSKPDGSTELAAAAPAAADAEAASEPEAPRDVAPGPTAPTPTGAPEQQAVAAEATDAEAADADPTAAAPAAAGPGPAAGPTAPAKPTAADSARDHPSTEDGAASSGGTAAPGAATNSRDKADRPTGVGSVRGDEP